MKRLKRKYFNLILKQDETLLSLAEKDWRNDVIHKIQQQENHTKNRSLGLSIKFGSRGSAFFARFYEKAKERSKRAYNVRRSTFK